jgi:hypothetical protein
VLDLILVVVPTLVIACVAFLCRRRRRPDPTGRELVWLTATAFALAGLVCLVRGSGFLHYLPYFTPWAVVSLASLCEWRHSQGRLGRPLQVVMAVTIVAWVPSLAWNGMRLREAVKYYGRLDSASFSSLVSQVIPKGVPVTGTPELFILAHQARLNFTPLPTYPGEPELNVAPDVWLILTENDWRRLPRRLTKASEAAHTIVFRGPVFRGVPYLEYPVVILRPIACVQR